MTMNCDTAKYIIDEKMRLLFVINKLYMQTSIKNLGLDYIK